MIRVAFFDIDGTLLSHRDYSISKTVLTALQRLKEKGVKCFICTGRNRMELEKNGIKEKLSVEGIIYLAGQVVEYCDEIIYSNPFPKEVVESIHKLTLERKISSYFYSLDDIWVEKEDQYAISEYYRYNGGENKITLNHNLTKMLSGECYEISLMLNNIELQDINGFDNSFVYARYSDTMYDLFPINGGKGEGVRKVCEYLNVSPDDCIAFGDSENDIDMLRKVGIGVAMGNATDFVKKNADYVTDDVDHDGVYQALKHFDLV